MASVDFVDNNDGILSVNETSPLIIRPQGTSPSISHHEPRHSTHWVSFYEIILQN